MWLDVHPGWPLVGAAAVVFVAGVGFGYWLAPNAPTASSSQPGVTRAVSYAEKPRTRLIGADESSTSRRIEEPTELSTEDLTSALAGAAHRRDFSERRAATGEIARKLDSAGLARAMEAANTLSVADRDWVQPTLISHWVEVDADTAIGWVRGLPQRQQRQFLLEEAFAALGLKDPATALRLMAEQQRFDSDDDVVGWVFDGWAQHDPQSAAVASLTLPKESDRDGALHAALRKWAVHSPEAALAWLERSPERPGFDSDVDTVFHLWAEQDPVAAGAWLNTLPEGEQRDEVAGTFAKLIVENDPEGACAWAASIGSPSQRESSVRETLRAWMRKDQPAALGWIRTSRSLSPKLRQEMLSNAR